MQRGRVRERSRRRRSIGSGADRIRSGRDPGADGRPLPPSMRSTSTFSTSRTRRRSV